MSEGRGLTLRKKRKDRPVISAPKNATGTGLQRIAAQPAGQSNNSLTVPPRDRNAPSETSDLVKRRYSTRYNQLPDFSSAGAPPVPSLPSMPTALKRRSGSPKRPGAAAAAAASSSTTATTATTAAARPVFVDPEAIGDPNLQAERYVTDMLSAASEQEIQDFQNSLQRLRRRNSADLQQSIFQNRTQFIRISKEAEKLKSEMSILQTLMSELTTTLGQGGANGSGHGSSNASDTNGVSQARRHPNRSSVANLEQMWNVQLQTLWKNVEKSQKFLPAVPGRHIVAETGNWIELDAATWKAKRPVHIVLLNDHLLVASKKRKRVDPNAPAPQGPAPTKLVAEECWPLQDVEIIDMATSLADGSVSATEEKAIASALTIRSAGRSLTYRHEKRDEKAKNGLLLALRKAVEDVRKSNLSNAKEESSSPKNDDYLAARDPSTAKDDQFGSRRASNMKPDILVEVDGKTQNFRWIEAQIDELDIDIALQRFDQAVESVERLRRIAQSVKGNAAARELVTAKVDERAAALAATLTRELVATTGFLEATKSVVSHLARLGYEDAARDKYLAARSEALTRRARECVFEGDLHRYVFAISYVFFSVVKNTVFVYQASFPAGGTSSCVTWANGHLEVFNGLLCRQLGAIERNGKLWRECMDVVWAHEREMLGEVGLDFGEVIGRGLEGRDASRRRERSATAMDREASRSKSRTKGGA